MQVKDVMTRRVEGIQASDNITHAAARMRDFDVGAIPVFEGNRLVGMITDRDICIRVVAASFNPAHTSVGEIMSKDTVTCNEDTNIQDAAKIMENYKIRRLLVKNDKEDIIGIVSLGDLAVHADKKLTAEILTVVSEHN